MDPMLASDGASSSDILEAIEGDSHEQMPTPLREILVVEDNPGDQTLIRAYLERISPGIGVVVAIRLEQAIEQITTSSFDAVLLDLGLPDASGLPVVERMAAAAPELPIVVLTGLDNEAMANDCLNAGAQDYISKSELAPHLLKRTIVHAQSRKHAENLRHKLGHINRLASLGRLVAGVAHEMNNPATVVMASLEIAQRLLVSLRTEINGDETRSGGSHAIAQAAEKIDEVIGLLDGGREGLGAMVAAMDDLRSFSRRSDARIPADVNEICKKASRLLATELRVRVEFTFQPGVVPPAEVHPQRLLQVIVNLLQNACQAFPVEDTRAKRIALATRADGDFIEISVTDNGVGIPAGIQARIFEPFFTTKASESGTGLGLSLARDFVMQMGGTIECTSVVGQGTTFSVRIPLKKQRPSEASGFLSTHRAATAGGPTRVLLVDDDPAVLASLTAMLGGTYAVSSVASALEALAYLDAGRGCDLVVSDDDMPMTTGRDLHGLIVQRFPHLRDRFVLMSGRGSDSDAVGAIRYRLAKPFSLETFTTLVERVFGKDN